MDLSYELIEGFSYLLNRLIVVSTNVGGVFETLPPDMLLLAAPTVDALIARLTIALVCV